MPHDPDDLWSQLKKIFTESNRQARREKYVPPEIINKGKGLAVLFGNDEIGEFDPELAVLLQNMEKKGGQDLTAREITDDTTMPLALLYGDLLPAMIKRRWIQEKIEHRLIGDVNVKRKTYSICAGFRVSPKEDNALKISHSTLDNDGDH